MTAFAPRWKPWRWCRVREPLSLDQNIIDFLGPRRRCRLTRHHFGRHGYADGRYFDARREGTP